MSEHEQKFWEYQFGIGAKIPEIREKMNGGLDCFCDHIEEGAHTELEKKAAQQIRKSLQENRELAERLIASALGYM